MSKSVIVLGGGGHASVLVDILRQLGWSILAIASNDTIAQRRAFAGLAWLSDDALVMRTYPPSEVDLVNAIGSLPGNDKRFTVYESFSTQGYSFARVLSPSACISTYAEVQAGAQIMPGAIINAGAVIGCNTIVNSGAIIEHDCIIGAHNHIAPGARVCGGVTTGNHVHIGTGANVIQGLRIGAHVMIGAGATVTKNVGSQTAIYGPRTVQKLR